MKNKPKELDWEKEFEIAKENGWFTSMGELDDKYTKDFISKTLQQQREEKIERVNGLIWKRDKKDGEDLITMENTHNSAISEVLKIMEEK